MVHTWTLRWHTPAPSSGAHLHLQVLHTCTLRWYTSTPSGGIHLHPQVLHTCTLKCCTPAPSGAAHLHLQMVHICLRSKTPVHSQYLKRQKQADDKLKASLGYIGKSRLSIKKSNEPTPSPNKINQSINHLFYPLQLDESLGQMPWVWRPAVLWCYQ